MTKIITEKYNSKNPPKSLYNFYTKSTESLIEYINDTTLSDDALQVILYILKYERNIEENQINRINIQLKRNLDYRIFNNYRLKVSENNDTLKLEYKNNNKLISYFLIGIFIISYLFLILPISIEKINDKDYIYVFVGLILIFPYIIMKMISRLKNEKNFFLQVDNKFFTIKSTSTNFNEIKFDNSDIQKIEIIDNGNYVLKLVATRKNKMQIEILSEIFSNIDRDKIHEYLTLIRNKIVEKLGN